MSRWRHLVFDLDGTLLHTLPDLTGSLNTVLKKYHCQELSETEVKELIGEGSINLVQRALSLRKFNHETAWENENLQPIHREFLETYRQNMTQKTRPYPGVNELLADWSKNGWQIFIISNKPHDMTEYLCHYYHFDQWSKKSIGAGEFSLKPEPGVMLHLQSQFGLSWDETLFVGDGTADMELAQRLNIDKIACLYGYTAQEHLMNYQPLYAIHNFSTLQSIIKS